MLMFSAVADIYSLKTTNANLTVVTDQTNQWITNIMDGL